VKKISTTKRSGTIGVDVGDRQSEVCILDAEGEVERRLEFRFGVSVSRVLRPGGLSGNTGQCIAASRRRVPTHPGAGAAG
jgi:hypothetical protein